MKGFSDITGMLGKFQEVQGKMKQIQEDLANQSVEASSGGGMVTATVNGKGDLLGVKIDPETVDPNDVEMLEDLVKAAVNAALAKSQELMKEEMGKLTGGLNIPGLDQLGNLFR
ncbi:MAG: YbaB/EbfC family nucleoid-associated protein [Planctomycetes bacterium]|nr:YbaB/EbfC family nucleoid-associated protein [Planctomycetota bacterium]